MKKNKVEKQNNIEVSTIKRFLEEELNWEWNEEIYDEKIEQYRKCFSDDFSKAAKIRFQLSKKDNSTYYFAIINVSENSFNYKFAMKQNDLSIEWQDFLAQKENTKSI